MGPNAVARVTLNFRNPAEAWIRLPSPQNACEGNRCNWDFMNPGDSVSVTLVARPRLGSLTTLELRASVRSNQTDHDRSNNQVTLELPLTLTDEERNLELWRQDVSFRHRETNPPLTDGSRIYLGSRGDEEIRAYSTANGTELWKHLAGVGIPSTAPVLHGNHVYYGTSDGHINAVSAQDGTLSWQHHAGPTIADPLRVQEDSIHFAAGNRYYSLNPNSRELDWEYEWKGDLSEGHLAVATSGKRIYLKVYGVNDADGRETKDTVIRAVDARSGRHLWDFATDPMEEERLYKHQLAASDNAVYVLGSESMRDGEVFTKIHSIRSSDGSLNWTTETRGAVYQMAADKRTVYVTADVFRSSHLVSALDSSTGRVTWDFPFETRYFTNGPNVQPAIADNKLYVRHTWEATVYAINTRTGALEWEFPREETEVGIGPVRRMAMDDGRLYLSTHAGVYGIDTATGRAVWAYSDGIDEIMLARDRLYVWTSDNHLAALRVKAP